MNSKKEYKDLESKALENFDISKLSVIFLDIDGVLNCQRGWEHYIGN